MIIARRNNQIICLLYCTLFHLWSSPSASAAEKWLIYADSNVIAQKLGPNQVVVEGFQYVGHLQFADPKGAEYSQPPTTNANMIYQTVFEQKTKTLLPGKPVVTKLDDTYVVLYSTRPMNFVCTKKDDAFTQVDATLVQPTGSKLPHLDEAV